MNNLMNVNIFSEDEDENYEHQQQIAIRPYVRREYVNNFLKWNDSEFFARFRLTKPTFTAIFEKIEDQLLKNGNRTRALSPINQLLLTLRFYATGNFLQAIGDFSGVGISTACRTVRIVSKTIAFLGRTSINMPRTIAEIRATQQGYFAMYGFPRVIGSIDCTHIRIQSPGGEDAELFRNRKGWFSLNVQVVCDEKLKATNIVARWPGSAHDSTIFAHSNLKKQFERNDFQNGVLLGDGGYAVSKYLLTPLLNPVSSAEKRYNYSQIRTRNIVERFFGIWKRRFPCLSLGLRLKISTVQTVIIATAVLHNLAIDAEKEEPIFVEEDFEDIVEIEEAPSGRVLDDSIRQSLVAEFFR